MRKEWNLATNFGCLLTWGIGQALIGAILLGFGILEFLALKKAQEWPSTSGLLLKDEVVKDGSIYRRDVIYTYTTADGIVRTNSDIELGSDSDDDLPELSNTGLVPRPIKVYYNPRRPEHSVLVLRFFEMKILVSLGGGMLIAAIVLLWSAISNKIKQRVGVQGVGWVKHVH